MQLNVTALFTTAQVELITAAVKDGAPSCVSVFAGRIADAGVDPLPIMRRSVDILAEAPRAELIWATPREVLNLVQADQVGCHIITMTHDLLPEGQEPGQGPRPVLAGDGPDVPPRRGRGRLLAVVPPSAKRALITGGAGFIGSTLADALLARGVERRDPRRLPHRPSRVRRPARSPTARELFEGDILDDAVLAAAVAGVDTVFHLQANADVRHGLDHPQRDLEQNTIATSNVLEAMRAAGATTDRVLLDRRVYGEHATVPTPEDAPFPVQTSLYGASKVAGEGMIAAYAHGYGFTGVVFRFVSMLGERYTHGHVIDFYRALKRDPSHLRVLGNGKQQKSYLYVRRLRRARCSTAVRSPRRHAGCHVYNLGHDETVIVDESVATITAAPRPRPRDRARRRQDRGWAGDSPLIHLDTHQDPRARLGAHAHHPRRDHAARWTGSSATRYRPRRPGGRHARERHLHPCPAAHLARRRRHRPAVVLRASTAAS